MRTKIDFGIDLGTTNSAIARIENGKPVIKKSKRHKPIGHNKSNKTRKRKHST